MSQVLRGKVKFFNRQKGFGFIVPDESGKKDVFLHAKYFSRPIEEYAGQVRLEFDDEDYRPPAEGDVLFYEAYDDQKGPFAVHWCHLEAWKKALGIISERPAPDNARTRMYRSGTRENSFKPILLWEGNDDDFRQKLDEGLPEVMEDGVYFEQLKVVGWERIWHPADWHPNYKK